MTNHRVILTGGPVHEMAIAVPTTRLHKDAIIEERDPGGAIVRRGVYTRSGVFGLFVWAGWRG